jgi:hypothetical protein
MPVVLHKFVQSAAAEAAAARCCWFVLFQKLLAQQQHPGHRVGATDASRQGLAGETVIEDRSSGALRFLMYVARERVLSNRRVTGGHAFGKGF